MSLKINEENIEAKQRIKKLELKLQETIEEFCESENFNVTYIEINASLLNVLKNNINLELKLSTSK